MSDYSRIARVEGIDESTGVFSMTLATEGEASDGHILSIKGGQIPEKMPLLVSHYNEPTTQAGSITNPMKELKDAPPRLRAVGHIEMSGEGPSAEIRRDLAHMIAKGHVSGMSIRWAEVPGKTVRRVNLPSDHPHYVADDVADGPERYGYFFEEWRALEGSIVAIGADSQALIGRADETEGAVSQFWRAMASDLEPETDIEITMELEEDEEPIPEPEPVPEPTPEAKQAAAVAAMREAAEMAREVGVEEGEIAEVLGVDLPTGPDPNQEILARLDEIEQRLDAGRVEDEAPPASPETEREEEGVPLAPQIPHESPDQVIDGLISMLRERHAPVAVQANPDVTRPREVIELLNEGLDEARGRVIQKLRAEIKKARGERSNE